MGRQLLNIFFDCVTQKLTWFFSPFSLLCLRTLKVERWTVKLGKFVLSNGLLRSLVSRKKLNLTFTLLLAFVSDSIFGIGNSNV